MHRDRVRSVLLENRLLRKRVGLRLREIVDRRLHHGKGPIRGIRWRRHRHGSALRLDERGEADHRSAVIHRKRWSRNSRSGRRQEIVAAEIVNDRRASAHRDARRIDTAVITSIHTGPPGEGAHRTSHS